MDEQPVLTPEQPPANYTQPHRTATEIIALHEAAAKRMVAEANEPKRLTQKQLDDIVEGQVELESAMLYGQQQRQITQEQMNHQMGMVNAGLQNSVAGILGMRGASDPLQGIPRDRPYWESMYGTLGQGMMPFDRKRGGK